MLAVCSAIRFGCRQVWHPRQQEKFLLVSRFFSTYSDDSDSSSDEEEVKPSAKAETKNAETLKKLNMLINSMIEKEFSKPPPQSAVDLKLAQPKIRRKKVEPKEEAQPKLTEEEKFNVSLENAARDVAEKLGGDTNQTENELLHKLLYRAQAGEPAGQEDVSAAKPAPSLSDLIAGMKIDHTPKKAGAEKSEGRAQQVRRILSRRGPESRPPYEQSRRREEREPPRQKLSTGRVNLFDSPPLGIFKKPSEQSRAMPGAVPELETWRRLEERELKLSVTHPPANIYEEMILWTDQGRLWQFPIDNEQGLDEEAKVFFAEHVFLERHLEPWCPAKGPVRHFMELVCVGLSKNPYITVKDKREHIEWYRGYFEDKKALLTEVGAISEGMSPPQVAAK